MVVVMMCTVIYVWGLRGRVNQLEQELAQLERKIK
jgi:hypothetical protein